MTLTRRTLLTGSAALAAATRLAPRNGIFAAETTPAQLARDPRRPQYPLLPPANWLNDPNGPTFWRGQYHMFYQYAVDPAGSSPKLWAHAVSPDMVHWRHLPIALEPTPGGPDAGGVWTGSALADGDRVAMFYAAVVPAPKDQQTTPGLRESQCLAYGSGPDLTRWTKVPAAVIPASPPGLTITGFRDPTPWRDGDHTYMAIGSGIRGRGGAVLLYRSSDLLHWDYLRPLILGDQNSSDPAMASDMWECPDFFPLPDAHHPNRHVLIHSTAGKAFWQSGSLDHASMTFHPERSGILDYGAFYAPKSQLDAHGDRILWGWITEDRSDAQMRAAGWSGMMSLPRILTLDADGNLRITVAPEVEKLRLQQQSLSILGNDAWEQQKLTAMTVREACGQILCSFHRDSGPLSLALVSTDKTWLTVRFDPAQPTTILIDNQRVPLGPGNSDAELRFYIDGSVIECFANTYGALTKRFYYEGDSAPPISIRIDGPLHALKTISTAQFEPISPNRLTS
jgi:beta-fructofuranosidase